MTAVAFQCRRYPHVVENNVVYMCHTLQATLPVTRRGWVSPWPVTVMPWAAIYDHNGNMIFAGDLRGLEERVVQALDAAPDFVTGGPYRELAELQAEMAADRKRTGALLAKARALAAAKEGSDAKDEAVRMLQSAERYVENRLRKADACGEDVVERAAILAELIEWFAGDPLEVRAQEALNHIATGCDLAREREASRIYEQVWTAFRALPPPGFYDYRMAYVPDTRPLMQARRHRIHAEFRWSLQALAETHGDTYAGSRALDDLALYPSPSMTKEAAAARLQTAEKFLEEKENPLWAYEGWLQLQEIVEGYATTVVADNTSDRAAKLAVEVATQLGSRLDTAAQIYRERQAEIEQLIRAANGKPVKGLSEMSRDDCLARLQAIAEEAGEGSYLAAEIKDMGQTRRPSGRSRRGKRGSRE